MITQIFLQLRDESGVQLRVVNSLKKHGLRTVKHVLKDGPNGGKLLAMEVEGDDAIGEEDIRNHISAVDGVMSTLKIAKVAQAVDAELSEDEKRYKSFESEAGDVEMRDRMLVFSLLSRYPKIANRLIELTGSIPAEDQPDRLYQLGRGFGQHLNGTLKVKDPMPSLDIAIEKLVVPGLSPLCNVTVIGSVLQVDEYTKNINRGKPDPLHCQFIQGAIEGMLKSIEELPPHRVEKKKCLHKESSACEYHIIAV
ncbi:MAG: hypothetical protein Kow006_10840 [Gammaproteobacteria bacterium]